MQVQLLNVAKVCQMSDNQSGKPTNPNAYLAGYGSGGDRCTQSCSEMVIATYQKPQPSVADAEAAMYKIVEAENSGRDVSVPEAGSTMVSTIKAHNAALSLTDTKYPSFAAIKACIDRSHMGIVGFNDYNKLMTSENKSPYSWHDPDNLGHVLVVVGYDDVHQWLLVHDPLIGTNDQPMWYTYASFQNAKVADLLEVNGPALNKSQGDSMALPSTWHDTGTELTNPTTSNVVSGVFREFILDNSWDETDVPVENVEVMAQLEVGNPKVGGGNQQVFRYSVLEQSASFNDNKVFKMYAGQEILALRKALADAQAPKPVPNPAIVGQALSDAAALFSSLSADLTKASSVSNEIAEAIKALG